MKRIAKRLLPAAILERLRRVRSFIVTRHSAKLKRFLGNSQHLLQCQIAYNMYGGYCVPLSSHHRYSAQSILAGMIWEPLTIALVRNEVGAGDIVHAGTFFGDFLPAYSQYCARDARVWAFEPNPENYRCSMVTVLVNGLDNVELINAGLGVTKGEVSLIIAEANGRALGGASYISDEGSKLGRTVSVKITSIDECVPAERVVSVIQLDVEGYELSALSGALATIRRCLPLLILETLPNRDWLEKNIFPLGYKVVGTVHENTVLRAK